MIRACRAHGCSRHNAPFGARCFLTHAVLLTRVGTGTNTLAAALALLDEEKVPRFETLIPRREAIAASFGAIPHNLHGYENVAAELMEVVA